MRAVWLEQQGRAEIRNLGNEALLRHNSAEGDVMVRVTHSSLNYKDALALTGKAPVVRHYPMIAGIDLAGVVETSDHKGFAAGDYVLATGYGLGEKHFGGFADYALVPGEWLLKIPQPLDAWQAMAVGTAGFTAMLSILALERAIDITALAPVLVTGASGGVGSMAVHFLSQAGYEVTASTGAMEDADYLKELGASSVIDRREFHGRVRPLGRETWAAAVDCVGSVTLANVLSRIRYGGGVAACGLAQGVDLPAYVTPFILRGVSLLGIDSVCARREQRYDAWERIAKVVKDEFLQQVCTTVELADIMSAADALLAGQVRGRIVVRM